MPGPQHTCYVYIQQPQNACLGVAWQTCQAWPSHFTVVLHKLEAAEDHKPQACASADTYAISPQMLSFYSNSNPANILAMLALLRIRPSFDCT